MLTLIKIDIDSIKKNRDAGNTVTSFLTGRTIKFSCHKLPECFIDGDNCFISSYEIDISDGSKMDFQGVIINNELLDKVVNDRIKGVKINVEFGTQRMNHLPTPKYSFKYLNTEIKCSNCGEIIMSDDLLNETSDYGDYRSNNVCPKCGEFDCCDIEYENNENLNKYYEEKINRANN